MRKIDHDDGEVMKIDLKGKVDRLRITYDPAEWDIICDPQINSPTGVMEFRRAPPPPRVAVIGEYYESIDRHLLAMRISTGAVMMMTREEQIADWDGDFYAVPGCPAALRQAALTRLGLEQIVKNDFLTLDELRARVEGGKP